MATRNVRAFLEVRTADGATAFCPTDEVLASAELQERCVEKRILRNIIVRTRKVARSNVIPIRPSTRTP